MEIRQRMKKENREREEQEEKRKQVKKQEQMRKVMEEELARQRQAKERVHSSKCLKIFNANLI